MLGFEVLRKLADGSAAEVFLARPPQSKDRVVLEVIRPELTSDMEVYGRFLDEVKERKALLHPNLLQRTSSGCGADGRLFAVTEPVHGDHLGAWIAQHGPLSLERALPLMIQLCDALAYLHEGGRVHGNLRPGNIFLTRSGNKAVPKLLDTGLALFRANRSVAGPTKRVLVEPEYLSPERIRGQRATPASDIYGMGVLMFEALTGRAPFTGKDPEQTRWRHLELAPPRLPPEAAVVAPALELCLAKEPRNRYPSVNALREALAAAYAQLPGRPGSGTTPSLRRHPATPAHLPRPSAAGSRAEPPSRPANAPRPSTPEKSTGTGRRDATVGISASLSAALSADALLIEQPRGEKIGVYEVEDALGQGGMGRVVLARHTRIDRKVAIKILRPELAADPTQLQRFFQEARAVNKISHEHIVEIYDFVEEPKAQGGRVYLVMEALFGDNLKAVAGQGPLQLKRTLPIVRQVCGALQAAHDVGVVHRDVKPDNIFLIEKSGKPDFVKVLDFGVAKLRANDAEMHGHTSAGMVIGTPAYMAPEQALGEPVDHRADIYALGSVLYTLLVGKPPFSAASLGLLVSKLVSHPPPPLPEKSLAGEPIPQGLRDIVARCLAKKPAQRFQSMRDLAVALVDVETSVARASLAPTPTPPPGRAESSSAGAPLVQGVLLDGRTTHDRPVPTPTPTPATLSRPRPLLLVAGGLLALLALAGLGALFASRGATPAGSAEKAPDDAPLIAPVGPTVVQSASPNEADKTSASKKESASKKKKR